MRAAALPRAEAAPVRHALSASETLDRLQSEPGGLSAAEAAERLARYGPNTLPERGGPGLLHIVLSQFRSPLIYVLLAAAAVSAALGHGRDAAFIAVIGALQGGHEVGLSTRLSIYNATIGASQAPSQPFGRIFHLDIRIHGASSHLSDNYRAKSGPFRSLYLWTAPLDP